MFLKISIVVCLLKVASGQEEPDSAWDQAAPASIKEKTSAYLKKFGYLNEWQENSLESFTEAVKKMQSFGGLQETGELDEETKNLMQRARCALPDIEAEDAKGKRFITSRNKWDVSTLTYKILNYPTNTENMSEANVEEAIANSFKKWTDVQPNLVISKLQSGTSSITLEWFSKTHTDKYAFDGPGRVFAHAFYPRSGKVHFDDDEVWVKTTPLEGASVHMEYVATHELGHTLGLKHTSVAGNVMNAYYPGYRVSFDLGSDDIAGITNLYG